jgi:parvulin-like peptidyl-prolyl isomerase
MKNLMSTTALAAAFALGFHGVPLAQAVDPDRPGSASGGILAQSGQVGAAGTGMTRSGSTQAAAMSEDQIRTTLRARGYSDIEGLERDGDHFKVGEARRYGEDVSDLRVNARTGQVQDEERLSEDQARKLLEDRGYSEVSDVSRDGDAISAKAKQGDRAVNLRIDARSGTVTQQQASN